MKYEIKPPGNVVETSLSDDPNDLSVVDLQIVATVLPEDHLDTLTSIRFTVDPKLTTNPASITAQAGSFGVWELVGPVDPGGRTFVASPVSTSPGGAVRGAAAETQWTFHLRDVEVAAGLEDSTITVTEIFGDDAGSTETAVVDPEGPQAGQDPDRHVLRIRKVNPVLRIDYFRVDEESARIRSGESVTLAWATVAAEETSLWGDAITEESRAADGSLAEDGTCTITPVTTSTYTLVATNGRAHAVAQVTVTVTDKVEAPWLHSTGQVDADGTVTASQVVSSGSVRGTELVSTGAVQDRHGPVVPTGLIAMWSGAIDEVPPGWALCDGGGDRPDLRSRFVVGARADSRERDYPVGKTGGADTVRLTSDQMPSHGHSLSEAGKHSHAVKGVPFPREVTDAVYGVADAKRTWLAKNKDSDLATTEVMTHVHTVGRAGRDGAHENRPPFYALAFIIKL